MNMNEAAEWKPAQNTRLQMLVLSGAEYKVAVFYISVRRKGKFKYEQRTSSFPLGWLK